VNYKQDPGYILQAVQAPSHAELVKEAQKLVDLARSKATQEQLDAQADVVAKLSEAAGTNKVVQDLNDGSFRGYTLTVRGTPVLCDEGVAAVFGLQHTTTADDAVVRAWGL